MNSRGQVLVILAIVLGSMLISYASLTPNLNVFISMLTPPKQALTSMYHGLEVNAIAYTSRIYTPDRVNYSTPKPPSLNVQASNYILQVKSRVESSRVGGSLWRTLNITGVYLFTFMNIGELLSLNSTVSASASWSIGKPYAPVEINTSYRVALTLQDLKMEMNPYRYGFIYNATIRYLHLVDNVTVKYPEVNFKAYVLDSATNTWSRAEILRITCRDHGVYGLAIDVGAPSATRNPYVIVEVEDSYGVILWFKCQA